MSEPDGSCELAVLGGGPGGYAAAIRAAQYGAEVTLIERDAFGGVCLNAGCIPSKALVSAAGLVHRVRTASAMGIEADPSVEMEQLAAWRDEVVAGMSGAVEKLCRVNGVTLRRGTARFRDQDTVAIEGDDGETTLAFDHAIVATGSRPIELDAVPFDADRILAAEDVLSLSTVPDRLVVVGAGYIGIELATAVAKLGGEVVVVEALDSIMPGFSPDLVRPIRRRLGELGVEVHLEHPASASVRTPDGIAITTAPDGGEGRRVEGDLALVAVGREPLAESVDPEAIGLERTSAGFLRTDRFGETTVPGIYAVGDVAGEPMLAHAATHAGTAVAATVAGETPTPVDEHAIPAAAFSDPEVAAVGHSVEDADAEGIDPRVGEFPLRASGRAVTANATEGFVRLVGNAEGRVIGGQAVGHHASELVGEIALAIDLEATLPEVGAAVHPHPTMSEAIMEAAENANGRAIHTVNR